MKQKSGDYPQESINNRKKILQCYEAFKKFVDKLAEQLSV
jgi:hypothetical protein